MRASALLLGVASAVQTAAAFWMGDIAHQGLSPFNTDATYTVFRNVKDFGAKGDGVTDDTAAINAAISQGNRCAMGACKGSTTTPAVVYFPAGTYIVSDSILQFYYTQLIGDPTAMPVIKGSSSFPGEGRLGLVDADQYQSSGALAYQATNVFFRQMRNLVLDTTSMPGKATALHWPSSQATTIQNCVFKLGDGHTGIFMEEGSGGFIGDLVFYGGQYGAQFGNQQYTARNLTFYNADTAIMQASLLWDWGWTYKTVNVVNCRVGINMSATTVGSVTLLDSLMIDTTIGIVTGRDPDTTHLPGQGSFVMENVIFKNVGTVYEGIDGVIIEGNSGGAIIQRGYVMGNVYVPDGPTFFEGSNNDYFPVPTTLLLGNKYYEQSKPQYEKTSVESFLSARSRGAKGDGQTDDTEALNALFQAASDGFDSGLVAFVDAGYYKVTDTIFIPPNTRIVGEALSSVIMGAGAKFSDIDSPYPVVQVGKAGDEGRIEWSDMIVSTQGATAGAVLIEYNLATPRGTKCGTGNYPSGMWDVHVRVGGFAGSNLQVAQCLKTPQRQDYVNPNCICAYMSMHITPSAGNLYMENNWLWVADHDIEDWNNTQISLFAGRGLLVESTAGPLWLLGTGVEHHVLYQYQFVNTENVFMTQIQTESPYYQPNPPAPIPFTTVNAELYDPDFAGDCANVNGHTIGGTNETAPCEMAWGLRIINSKNIKAFGAGHYSFFNNYSTDCSAQGNGEVCQARIVSVQGAEGVEIYNLDTIGSVSMVTREGADIAVYEDNVAGFADTAALFKY